MPPRARASTHAQGGGNGTPARDTRAALANRKKRKKSMSRTNNARSLELARDTQPPQSEGGRAEVPHLCDQRIDCSGVGSVRHEVSPVPCGCGCVSWVSRSFPLAWLRRDVRQHKTRVSDLLMHSLGPELSRVGGKRSALRVPSSSSFFSAWPLLVHSHARASDSMSAKKTDVSFESLKGCVRTASPFFFLS